jgi:hypothetical protein
MSPYIVSGFYTPDYAHWYSSLRESLDCHNQPHDFAAVPKLKGSWELNVLVKAQHILGAMDRHPDKVIIWLDVDCTVRGDLAPLAQLRGDVGIHHYQKMRRGRYLITRIRSATLTFRPTPGARRFVEAWHSYSRAATVGEDDEATLTRAMLTTPDVTISQIPHKWSATLGKYSAESIIVHSYASWETPKVYRINRFLHRHLGTRAFKE